MADTLVKVYVHLIFHIKTHSVTVRKPDLGRLFAYLGGIVRGTGGIALGIGGMPDHVHILAATPKTMSLSDFVRTVKKESSVWLKTTDAYYAPFAWQTGYGAFSVSPTMLDKTLAYIEGQEIHHQKRTFEEEYRLFLEAYQIEYDAKYVTNY